MEFSTLRPHYSSDLSLTLLAEGQEIAVAKLGPGYVVLSKGVELPPCEARIVMTVDDRTHFWPVRLPEGSVPFEETVRTEEMDRVLSSN